MPNKELLKQLEIEKQRRGISSGNIGGNDYSNVRSMQSKDHRYAWEYELEAYRAQQKKTRWLAMGALCGILSLVLEVVFHWGDIAGLVRFWPFK